jgi:hypothetical protein
MSAATMPATAITLTMPPGWATGLASSTDVLLDLDGSGDMHHTH